MVRRDVRWVIGPLVLAIAAGCGGTSKPKPATTPPAAAAPAPAAPPPGATQVSEATASDIETLFNRAVPPALEQIEKHGTFAPYAVVVTNAGEYQPVIARPDDPKPTSQMVVDLLIEELRKRAGKNDLKVVCIVVGGTMKDQANGKPMDVIQTRLEHVDGTAVEIYLPWTRGKDKKVKPGEGFAGKGVPVVFTR